MIAEILSKIEAAGVELRVTEAGHLRLIGSDEARAAIKDLARGHKAELLALLTPAAVDPIMDCRPSQRHWVPVPGTERSQCTACGQCQCWMLTADT